MTVLEGESLVNDASALVLLRSAVAALAAGAPQIHPEAPGNVIVEGIIKTDGFDAAWASAHRVITVEARSHRQNATPMEPRGALALILFASLVSYDRADPAFSSPSKPIGGFMEAAEAERRRREMGWTVMEDAGRGMTPGKRFGTVLVEMGYLEPKELVRGVVEQTKDIILLAFHWTTGDYRLDPGPAPGEAITLDMSTPQLILDGISQIEAWSREVPIHTGSPATAHLFIYNPFSAGGVARLFSTHPPTEERVARLMAMAEGLTNVHWLPLQPAW